MTFRWLKEGQEVTNGSKYDISSKAFSTLSVLSIEPADRGNYTCIVSNSFGSSSYSSLLQVRGEIISTIMLISVC